MDQDPEECFLQYLDQPYSQISISVIESVARGYGLSSYVGYIIKIKYPKQLTVQRRFSQFDALREVLVKRWPGVLIPPLPAKHTSGSNSLKVVNERIKYLSYFLNNCVRLNFVFMSEQFQLFLTSTNPDLKKQLQRMGTLPALLMLNRYEKAFPQVKVMESRRGQLMVLMKDQIQPFFKYLQSQRMVLINLKREVFKLAQRREEYLRATKVLFGDTLPNLQNHLSKIAANFKYVLLQNEQIKECTSQLKQSSARNYWIVYQALKLQLGQSQAMVDALQSRVGLIRQYQRFNHEIEVNEQQLAKIQTKKMSLKQFFNRNSEQLTNQLQHKNKELRQEIQSLKLLILFVAEIVASQLIEKYYKRRQALWRKAFENYISKQKEFNNFKSVFYKLLLKQ